MKQQLLVVCRWDEVSDECWGWCGPGGSEHQCDAAFVHIVGEDDDAFHRLKQAFLVNKVVGGNDQSAS